MPRSQGSDDSRDSNASSFHSVEVTDKGKGKAIAKESRKEVPEDSAPTLFKGAEVGMYDQASKSFYAVTTNNPRIPKVSRWDEQATKWVAENSKKIVKALVEIVPTLIQGAANLVPEGKAKMITNAIGVGAQGVAVGTELYHAYKAHGAGEATDAWTTTATAARFGALGANLTAALVPTGSVAATISSGLGTYGTALSTGINLAHTPQGRGGPMYQHPRTNIGYEMGDVEPGLETPDTRSSHSSLPTQANAAYYNPTMHDQAYYAQQPSSSAAASSSKAKAPEQSHLVRR
ncbi:hypothetical protein ACFRDV_26615 [Streptomyces fagopyri]|uniref:Uncharacterized protein n=1 Tax=Streptomyces fagopyri TaxID=2662397 RepID=A0A5Q0L4N0_9ACTN|nr:hypothetical protein [Streptomyces fagopyri]QFZ71903.1 hypothetical protein GFH48_00205 [Streptomyces fagopyri]